MKLDDLVKAISNEVDVVLKASNNDGSNLSLKEKKVLINVSARHVHLSREHVEILFGKNYKLKKIKDLIQPGQFACEEKVILIGKKGIIEKVRVLGPERSKTQVEISLTDARKLGINPPIRDSGDLAGSEGIILVGPNGAVKLDEGVIIAKRHIHCDLDTASKLGLKDKQIVKVRVEGPRAVIFDEVLVRVSEKYAFEMHIDTDEANAAFIKSGIYGTILK